jgi:O-antigen/teichoic acid export membrane protein
MTRASQTHKATRWNAAGRGADALIRYGVVVVLVQQGWMTPLDWGILEGVLLITGFLDQFTDLGTGQAVVQRRELDDRFLSTIFWFNIGVGAALGGLVLAGSEVIASGLGAPEIASLARALSPSFLILALGLVQRCLLTREMRFDGIARVNVLGAVVYGCLALVLAANGWRAWSLALATLTSGLVQAAGYWRLSSWRPSAVFDGACLKETYRFSSRLVGANLAGYLLTRGDRILAARFLGTEALGVLGLARRIIVQPARSLPMVVVGTLIPSLAQVKLDRERFRDRSERALAGLAFIIVPVLVGLALTADLWMRGDGEAVDERVLGLIWLLLPFGICHALLSISGPVYVALGRTDLMLRVGLAQGLWLLAVEAFGLWEWGGTTALAAANSVGMLLAFPFALRVPVSLSGSTLSQALRGPLVTVACAALMGGGVLALRSALSPLGLPWALEMGLVAGAGAGVYSSLALGLRPPGAAELLQLLGLHSLSSRLAPRP